MRKIVCEICGVVIGYIVDVIEPRARKACPRCAEDLNP